MAKLFIGCNYIDFMYANASYQGILSKIILEEKTIFRIDYTCRKDQQTGRLEINYTLDPVSRQAKWAANPGANPELARILQTAIEKNPDILQLEN